MSQRTLIHRARYAVTRWNSLASTGPGTTSAMTRRAKGQSGCSTARSAGRALRERNCEEPKLTGSHPTTLSRT